MHRGVAGVGQADGEVDGRVRACRWELDTVLSEPTAGQELDGGGSERVAENRDSQVPWRRERRRRDEPERTVDLEVGVAGQLGAVVIVVVLWAEQDLELSHG